MTDAYHETRLPPDPKREIVWQALWRYFFRPLVAPEACVLDLGAGYGSFINQVEARRRIAVDSWPGMAAHLRPGIEAVIGDVAELGFLADRSIDFAFASNVFEHLPQPKLLALLAALKPKLASTGTLTILQPNYRYAYREYFDDYTHVAVYSHISLADLLSAAGFEVFDVRPRFLPLTVKSRLPVSPLLIRAYLASPIKPMGGQMLLRARPAAP